MKSLKTELPPELVPPKPSKYRNVPTVYNGVRYQSKAEAERARVLDSWVAAGVIQFWIGQPKFRLGVPENVYIGDFLVIGQPTMGTWAEDTKGRKTQKFLRDVRLWRAYGPCKLIVIRKGQPDEVIPGGKEWKSSCPSS